MNSLPKIESQTVEFKTSFNEDVIETLVAFANAKGGTVYIGVSDNGKTQGWQYPLDAIREIVLNMIIHRDYTSVSNSIVKIFPDHILFFNPGTLPDTITIEQLRNNQYISTPRNRQIAKTAKEMGWIEHYGTGIRRVRKMFFDYGLQEPQYEIMSGGMVVTVFGLKSETVEKTVEKILDIIADNPQITQTELVKITGLTRRGIEWNISKLKSENLLERIGADKGGYWKVKSLNQQHQKY